MFCAAKPGSDMCLVSFLGNLHVRGSFVRQCEVSQVNLVRLMKLDYLSAFREQVHEL